MAERAAEVDSNMELLVDLGMDDRSHSPDRRLSFKGSFHSDSLLAPDTDFLTDDRSSAASGLDVADRITYLEQRMQMQEDEIQLLKMALADVLKRLNITEEHQAAAAAAAGKRPTGAKARPVSLALPSRPTALTSSSAMKKSTTTPSSGTGRTYSPTPSSSGVKSPPGSVKDSPCKMTKTRPGSAATTSKKPQEGTKPKEATVSLGTRRVTHCKVTMQICLSPLTRKTGCSEATKSSATVPTKSKPTTAPNNPQAKSGGKPEKKKSNPSFTLNLQKTMSTHSTPQETSSYQSPVKSPSQYFQICY